MVKFLVGFGLGAVIATVGFQKTGHLVLSTTSQGLQIAGKVANTAGSTVSGIDGKTVQK